MNPKGAINLAPFNKKMMTEKQAISYIKDIGVMKFKLLADGTLYFESLEPLSVDDELYIVEAQFYIKDGGNPMVFEYDRITNFKHSDLQIAEINLIGGEQLYFSEYINN